MSNFERWIYVVPGYTQNRGTSTRLIRLWKDLHDEFDDAETSVQLHPWNSNWKAEAEFVSRLSYPRPEIYVVGYSWGAGYGMLQLANQLHRHGARVKRAWLLDPVYRHYYALGQWRAFVKSIPIMIPDNVDRVTWWRQEQSIPMGHDLLACDEEKTTIDAPNYAYVDHIHMDDDQLILSEIHSQIKESLK